MKSHQVLKRIGMILMFTFMYGMPYAVAGIFGLAALSLPDDESSIRAICGVFAVIMTIIATTAMVMNIHHNYRVNRSVARYNSQPGVIELEARWW